MDHTVSVAERVRVLDGEDRAQTIRDRLRDAIVDRRLAPGTKLSEAEIGDLFKVSRTVTRAALQMLSYEGLVRSERNRGAFVSSPSPDDAAQIFASRRLIEPGIVAAAINRLSHDDVPLFRQQLEEQRRLVALHSPAARRAEIQASGDFHLLLAEVAGNAILKKFMDELVARSSLVIALYGRSGVSSCGYDDHARILEAIEALDVARATDLMLHHINHIEADLDLRVREEIALKDALMLPEDF
jgi:DNA-binding GntR family transcriptional regulator